MSAYGSSRQYMRIMNAFVLLILLTATPPVSISKAHSKPASKHERREYNLAWKAIRKSCVGRWSGSMGNVADDGSLIGFGEDGEMLNFRLHVKVGRDKGTWTVWNLKKKGDETVVPLTRIPISKQLKFGFPSQNIVLRTPGQISDALPRMAWEIGFWDSGVRRTAVMEYQKRQSRMSTVWVTKDTTVVQMKRKSRWSRFVGNDSDPTELQEILPEVQPLAERMSDFISSTSAEDWKVACSSVVIDVPSMRRRKTALDKATRLHVLESILQPGVEIHRRVLPNGLGILIPHRLNLKGSPTTMQAIFLSPLWTRFRQRRMRVVVVDYGLDGNIWIAKQVALHTFRRS
uniref:Uncharacterized protein n=1 Tax=Grammatophora oceanica TaxID=210454 RepID=A0A7S1Y7U9_9STRA|mmetsp:Transcript_29809/g.43968  ORF Transcript_29809/g.43968 Transcript_29809/m.43968 type:complete len:345 (+) Transcript_29809:119-1153(+)